MYEQKPRVITPGLVAVLQSVLAWSVKPNLWLREFRSKSMFNLLSGRAEGGRVELQWLMSHSLV